MIKLLNVFIGYCDSDPQYSLKMFWHIVQYDFTVTCRYNNV